MSNIKIGLMGFGQTGRQIYDLASRSDDLEIAAIADIGDPKILHYLLCSEVEDSERHRLDGNFLANDRFQSRLMAIDTPKEMPWDIFGVDAVIDSTGKYRDSAFMEDHLDNGAPRVFLRTLPTDHIDRIIIPIINEDTARADDLMISAGSYVDKYGPEERYNIMKFANQLSCPTLITYGQREVDEGSLAFAGVPDALRALPTATAPLESCSPRLSATLNTARSLPAMNPPAGAKPCSAATALSASRHDSWVGIGEPPGVATASGRTRLPGTSPGSRPPAIP